MVISEQLWTSANLLTYGTQAKVSPRELLSKAIITLPDLIFLSRLNGNRNEKKKWLFF